MKLDVLVNDNWNNYLFLVRLAYGLRIFTKKEELYSFLIQIGNRIAEMKEYVNNDMYKVLADSEEPFTIATDKKTGEASAEDIAKKDLVLKVMKENQKHYDVEQQLQKQLNFYQSCIDQAEKEGKFTDTFY